MTTSSSNDPYAVERTRRAERDVERQRSHRALIYKALSRLESEPFRGHLLTGSLKGVRALAFSVPGTAFHAGSVVQAASRLGSVFLVGPHENIYAEAERRFRALPQAGDVGD